MKKLFALGILLFSLLTKALAQNNLPPLFEIKSDSIGNPITNLIQLKKFVEQVNVLEDHSGKLTVEQVMKPPFSLQFHPNTKEKLQLNAYAYWFQYRIKNTLDHAITISFPNASAYCDLYVINSNHSIRHFKTGTLVPWSKRDGAKRICAIRLTLQPHEEVLCYQRQRLTFWFLFKPFELWWGFTSVHESEGPSYTENGEISSSEIIYNIISGMLILAFLFNIILYSISRDKIYLFYSFFLFCIVVLNFLSGDGPIGTESAVFLNEYPHLLNVLYWVFISLYILSTVLFLSNYIELPIRFPKWNNFLKKISYFPLLLIIFPFISTSLPDTSNKLIIAFVTVLIHSIDLLLLFTFLFYLRFTSFKKINLVIVLPYLLVSAIIFPLLDLYFLVLQLYGIKVPYWISWFAQWGNVFTSLSLVILVLFISYRLLKRFDKYREQLAQERIQKEIERASLIEQQKIELEKTVEERTAELKTSLNELKSTQAQLIQSEKMASLGELTAGIAHEIQNPLNFVNNFSEVNNELVNEINSETNIDEIKAIANDIKQNSEKISFHGKRADAIVKNMLQHSRQTKGVKEPTDINTLCDEYLRLAYHGMRAKNKSFNAEFTTDFNKDIGKIDIVPQDIGRVLLNLFNNAFYAVNEKEKAEPVEAGYQPTVSAKTRKINDKIEIIVSDNGNGIPASIKDKIFQPFFTTKPTGEGTGLGLSLSYDIITKEHNGTIKVESKEREGSEFVVQLPLTTTS